MLAMDRTGSLAKVMTEEELINCDRNQDLYYCRNGNIYDQNYKQSCVFALYSQDTHLIKENCHFYVIPYHPVSLQLNSTTFLVNHGKQVQAQIRCHGHKETTVLLQGRTRVTLSKGCQMITAKAILESSFIL